MSLYQVDALRRVGERLRRSDRLRAEGCGPESAPPSPGGGARRGPAALAWGGVGAPLLVPLPGAPLASGRSAVWRRWGPLAPFSRSLRPPARGGLRSPRRPVAAAAVPPAAPAPLPAPSGAGAAGFVPRPPHSRGRRRLRVPPWRPLRRPQAALRPFAAPCGGGGGSLCSVRPCSGVAGFRLLLPAAGGAGGGSRCALPFPAFAAPAPPLSPAVLCRCCAPPDKSPGAQKRGRSRQAPTPNMNKTCLFCSGMC